MAGSRRGERNGSSTGRSSGGIVNLMSEHSTCMVFNYDIDAIGSMLAQISHLSLAERLDILRKNIDQFKKNTFGAYPNQGKAKVKANEEEEENDVEDDDEEEDTESDAQDDDEEEDKQSDVVDEVAGEDEDDETLKLEVPNEGEPECKKPRLAEGSGCQAEAAV